MRKAPRNIGMIGGKDISLPRVLLAALMSLAAGVEMFFFIRGVRRDLASKARLNTVCTMIPSQRQGAPVQVCSLRGARSKTPPVVVLVHGYGIGLSYFVPLTAELGSQVSVYAPALPGHAPSKHDGSPLTIAELAAALGSWMDACGLQQAVLVGHSLGCQIAAELTLRRPELVTGLVLIGPTSDAGARTRLQQGIRLLCGARFERSSLALWIALDYTRAGARVLTKELREMLHHRIEDLLPRIRIPVRVLRGARDTVVPQRWAEEVARRAKAPPPAVIEKWGHAVHYGDPKTVARFILRFSELVQGARCSSPKSGRNPSGFYYGSK